MIGRTPSSDSSARPGVPGPGASEASVTAPASPSYRVLLVSDHRAAAEALRAHLARHGFAVVAHETNADGAAAAARRDRPHLVLVDAAVPGGWQPVVTALDGLIARRHVAVLAAYWSIDARRAAAATGIGAMLLKRVDGVELIERLRSLAGAA